MSNSDAPPEPKYAELSEVRVEVGGDGAKVGDVGTIRDVLEGVNPETGEVEYNVYLDEYQMVFTFGESEIEPTGRFRDADLRIREVGPEWPQDS